MSNESKSQKQTGVRATQKAATGQAVLEAAREEFERVGFEAANLRAIAARAGVSAGTVLHHYGDKRELLHAALFDDLEETLRQALEGLGPGPLEKQLSALTRTVFGYYQRRPKLSRTLLKESLFADEPWAGKFTAQVGGVHGAIARLAQEASARGELRPGVDGALFGAAYFSFFYFALISWVQGAHPAPVAMVERLIGQHLEGLRPPSSLSPRRKER
ncbi:TetR/AcrR family transcriptional regulator [Archangium violaceum]|uniref:TetR family transcriptional regulator n=1 Tax=Archangium violaceum Cb vi76 TaxID=1406225 RepID=A0A084SZG2_9BACT|nr:TetR/AcrR family transcriptional regulator [Archangium violaceum]KFA93847.1 TetR family transcriptional regulator [Archangium violaceum Cb vi76]